MFGAFAPLEYMLKHEHMDAGDFEKYEYNVSIFVVFSIELLLVQKGRQMVHIVPQC